MTTEPSQFSNFDPLDPESSMFSRLPVETVMRRGRMGDAYIKAKRLTEAQVEQIVAKQNRDGVRFGEAAVSLGFLSEEEVNEALLRQFNNASFVGPETAKNIKRSLAIVHAPGSQDAESIRRLRGEVQARMEREPRFALTVVSPIHGEGKSHVAASLAISFAQIGVKTMLIDANLRNPVLHRWFNAPNQTGLSTMLARRSPVSLDAVHKVIPGLWLLSSGPLPPNPAEILSPPKLSALLAVFDSEISLFIIDTPASLSASDAQTIARQSGHALMVVRKHVSRLSDIKESKEDLQNLGVQVIGTVYNEPPDNGMGDDLPAHGWWAKLVNKVASLFKGRTRKVFD